MKDPSGLSGTLLSCIKSLTVLFLHILADVFYVDSFNNDDEGFVGTAKGKSMIRARWWATRRH